MSKRKRTVRRFLFRLPLRAAAVLGAAVGSTQYRLLRLVAFVYVILETLAAFPREV